jgi:inner membrane transporter RhtA
VQATGSRPVFGAVGLIFIGMVCQEAGASFAVLLFPVAGPLGMVALRIGFSAIILLLIARPSLRGYGRRDWATVVLFGVVLAAMNGLFYEAIERIPLGAAVTIEVLGPLVLSVAVSRRASSWLWAALALAGVLLLGRGSLGELDPLGVLLVLGAAAMWALYILLSSRTGRRFPKLDGLAISMTIGGLIALPFGIATAGTAIFQPHILLVGAAVAALSSAIPYALDLVALRRIHAGTHSILMSLSPAVAAASGFLLLGQGLNLLGMIAIALVIVASIGAVRSATSNGRALPGAAPEDWIG